jgi:hypothetical protein
MPVGSAYDAEVVAMLVDEEGSCYLDPDAKIVDAGFIHVRRDEVGYHVTVRLLGVQWIPGPIPEAMKAKLITVETLTGGKK